MLARRDVFERVGAFPTELLVTEYLDWYLRAREAGVREITLADVLAHRRVHGGNNSFRLRHRRSEFASILKASLDRRRAQG
jgi:GT2 family glycosyltransferase